MTTVAVLMIVVLVAMLAWSLRDPEKPRRV